MIDFLQNALALIVTLGVLVTIHEYGHFWVARRCGVRVLRFSVGFGKALVVRRGKSGTEYVIAAIPLGGYVKMLDEREGPVPEEQIDQAFNRKPVGQRMAIAAAGPVANFLFAFLVYTVMYGVGVSEIVPKIGAVLPDTPASSAEVPVGGEVVSVDGRVVTGWNEVNLALVERVGESGSLLLAIRSPEASHAQQYVLPLNRWLAGEKEPNVLAGLGLEPWRPPVSPRIDTVVSGSPAERAGLKSGDLLLSADSQTIEVWTDFVGVVSQSANQQIPLEVSREGQRLSLYLVPEARESAEGVRGFAGVSVLRPEWPEEMRRKVEYGFVEAITKGVEQTYRMSGMILDSITKMIAGLISVENLGGPITIAKAAGASAEYGLESYLTFLAQLSVMLAVLNLLPIPVLDGGHLLYYSVEWLRGRPISEAGQLLGLKVGMVLLGGVMFLALFNDFARL